MSDAAELPASLCGRSGDERDPLGLRDDAPLLDGYLAALERRQAGEHPFCTPGHKGSIELTGTVVASDVPAFGGVATIKAAHGVITEAERRAAELFGAQLCRFSVQGSTHCNQTLALALGRPGDAIVVSRTLHRSILLGLVLAGLRPIWLAPEVDTRTGLPAGFSPQLLQQTLAAHPEAVGVFLGDPSYVGTHSDLAAHAEVAHAADIPLVVDAAWSAHFGFHPQLPRNGIQLGADAIVTSFHKTLPAYTQGAILLVNSSRLDPGRLDRAFEATLTTSPSGTIYASLDATRVLLARHGERLMGRMLTHVAEARRRLREVTGLLVLEGHNVDPAKITVLLARTGADGIAVETDLIAAGLPVEMADRDTLVPLVTIGDDGPAIERMTDRLIAAIERHRGAPRALSPAAWIVDPVSVVAPREAFFGETEVVPAAAAIGRVSAELIAPYPPGVPVLAPGELITEAALGSLQRAHAEGVRIAYAASPALETIEVLAAPGTSAARAASS